MANYGEPTYERLPARKAWEPYTRDDHEVIKEMFEAGETFEAIAKRLDRTASAIISKVGRMPWLNHPE